MAVVLTTITEPSITLTGTLISAAATVTGLSSTAALFVGMPVSGTGVPYGTLIATIASATALTLTQNATASGAVALTFPLEPLTLTETKNHLRVTFTDDDWLIANLISASRRRLEVHTKRAFINTTFDAAWDSFPFGGGYYNRQLRQFYGAFPGGMGATFPGFLPTNTGILEVPRPPLVSVTSITYYDATGNAVVLDSANYVVQAGIPGRIEPTYGHIWPTTLPRIGAVTIRFVAGYGASNVAVPSNVKAALLLVCKSLYDNRDEVNESYGTAHELPQGVDALLSGESWGGYS